MPDVFISYSSQDGILARQFKEYMTNHGIESFLAEINIEPGSKWKNSIIEAFNQSKWIFFLATPSACASKAVMHEIGGALFGKKELITVLCDMDPKQLPEWIQDTQAINLRKQDEIIGTIQKIAETIKSDKFKAGLVAGGLAAFAALILFSDDK
jgi:TIR domain